MNLLAIKLFVTKYYDWIFLGVVLAIGLSLFLYQRYLAKSRVGKLVSKSLGFIGTKKGNNLLLILLLLVGLGLRLYKLTNPIVDWHSFRQADTAAVTRVYLDEGLDLLTPRYYDLSTTQSGMFNPGGYRFVEFPVFNLFHYLLIRYLPFFSLEVWGRLLSICASLLSAYTLYLIAKKEYSPLIGILSAGFFLLLPFNVYFSRVILPEPMAVTFGLLSIYYFSRYLDKSAAKFLIFSALSFVVSILMKPYLAFYAVVLFYFGYRKFGNKLFSKKELYVAVIAAVIPFALWRVRIADHPEGIPFWKWTFNGDDIRFRPAFWYWLFGERLTKLILGFGGLVPFSFGLLLYKKGKALTHAFLFGVLVYVSVIATANVRHDYYQTIIVPAISLALAQGALYLWSNSDFNKTISRIFLTVSLAVMFFAGAFQIKEFYKINHPEIIVAGQAVDKLTPKDAVVIAAYNGDTAFLYQTKRRGWPVVDRPIDELIEKGVQYYVSVNLDHPQTQEFMQRFDVIDKTNDYVIIKLK